MGPFKAGDDLWSWKNAAAGAGPTSPLLEKHSCGGKAWLQGQRGTLGDGLAEKRGPRIHSCAVSFLWGDTQGCRGRALSEGELQDPPSSMLPQASSDPQQSVLFSYSEAYFCSTSDGHILRGI